MDFETLLKQWANEQGFQTWSQDHAAVLGNLAKWLNQHAAQQSAQRTWLESHPCNCTGDDNFCHLPSCPRYIATQVTQDR